MARWGGGFVGARSCVKRVETRNWHTIFSKSNWVYSNLSCAVMEGSTAQHGCVMNQAPWLLYVLKPCTPIDMAQKFLLLSLPHALCRKQWACRGELGAPPFSVRLASSVTVSFGQLLAERKKRYCTRYTPKIKTRTRTWKFHLYYSCEFKNQALSSVTASTWTEILVLQGLLVGCVFHCLSSF